MERGLRSAQCRVLDMSRIRLLQDPQWSNLSPNVNLSLPRGSNGRLGDPLFDLRGSTLSVYADSSEKNDRYA